VKTHLLVFDSSQASRKEVIQKVDRIPAIVNRYAFFENTLCLASEEDAKSLSNLLRHDFPKPRFLISEIEPQNKGGWLPEPIWEFLNDPKPAKADA